MKVGVIGRGATARRGHFPLYKALNADIVAVVDLNKDKAKLNLG